MEEGSQAARRAAAHGTSARRDDGPVMLGITNALVRLHAERYGRGPTRAKTHMAGDDILVCLIEDMLTPVEKTFVATGQEEQVHALRSGVQDAMRDEFTSIVREQTGREVVALMSQVSVEPAMAVEVFVLA